MTVTVEKVLRVYRESGTIGLTRRVFQVLNREFWHIHEVSLRPLLPDGDFIRYAGIPIGRRKIGDQLLAQFYDPPDVIDIPDYESALVSALKTHVKKGDRIVVVGVGAGVTCVIAALAAGETGHVECYEGDLGGIKALHRVAGINGVLSRIKAHHAIVGEAIGVYGSTIAKNVVQPSDLPSCDILELDCEGAEVGILSDMTISPRIIAVETHGFLGAPTEKVRDLLSSRGYEVEELGWAEPRHLKECTENDIRVLVGARVPVDVGSGNLTLRLQS
jgi:Methyltransferase FkbM domain